MAISAVAQELMQAAAQAADDKQGTDLVAYDVSAQLPFTDVFLLITAQNERQVGAVAEAVEERLHKLGAPVLRREGERENRWVLLDFNDIVVHVFHAEERQYYSLERIWGDCPQMELPDFAALQGAAAQDNVVQTNLSDGSAGAQSVA